MANLGIGECRICNKWTSLEEEHILSDWFGKQVRRYGPFTLPGHPPTAKPDWWKLPVCRPCNKRLGKSIEEPASKVLKTFAIHIPSSARQLSGREQKVIARWIVKVNVMMAMIHTRTQPPSIFLDWLRAPDCPKPPPDTAIWVGNCVPNADPMSDSDRELIEPGSDIFKWERFADWAPLLVTGNLAMFLVYGHTKSQGVIAGFTPPLGLKHPAETLGFISPLRFGKYDVLDWPPQRAFNAADADTIMASFIVF